MERSRNSAGRILGLIPARGGSTRVLRKNIRLLAGHPLIAYTVRAARESCIQRTVVSTDDEEIAAVSRAYGAEVPFLRPKELAEDTATSLSVIRHALGWLKENERYWPGLVCYMSPTCPFRTARTIDAAAEMLVREPELDSAVTVRQVVDHPYSAMREGDDGRFRFLGLNSEGIHRSQDLPPIYVPVHAVFASRPETLFVNRPGFPCFNPENVRGVVISRLEAIDIDTEDDFEYAEFIAARRKLAPAPGTR